MWGEMTNLAIVFLRGSNEPDFISYDARMDAQPELAMIAGALNQHGLEAILIGNMAAALHGAPVTTVDIDFFFRKTPRNLKKLKAIAGSLGAVILRPYYPVSELYRVVREHNGLQVDFMGWIDGVKSYESVRGRATTMNAGGYYSQQTRSRSRQGSRRSGYSGENG
jgi:hypothetical protein